MTIHEFQGQYRFLSNFWPCVLNYLDQSFTSVEAAYQAQKCADRSAKYAFSSMTAGESKRAGRRIVMREDWNVVKLSIMYDLVYNKFHMNPQLGTMLKATHDHRLIEGNAWNDTFWGVCRGVGSNYLGQILMQVRDTV